MNRQRALRKKWGFNLLSLACLTLPACVSEESFQAKSGLPLERSLTSKTKLSAALIGAEDIQQYHQLRPHAGQILLARDGLQLVLPPLALVHEEASHYSLLAQIYRQQRKSWLGQTWMALPEISLQSASGEVLQLVGREIESRDDVARVIATFRGSGTTVAKPSPIDVKVVMSLSQISSALEVEIISDAAHPIIWDLRMSRGMSEELAIPYREDWLAGYSMALLPDVISLVSSTPLRQEYRDSFIHLQNQTPAVRSGFYLLLDKAAHQLQTSLVAQAIACYQTPEAAGAIDCLRPAWTPPQLWTVSQAAPASKKERRFARPLYIHSSDGSFRSVLSIQEGEQLKIGLSPFESFELLYPDGSGVLTHKKPEGPIHMLELPLIEKGALSLDLLPAEASFVELRDAVHRDGISLPAMHNFRSFPSLSPHAFLQKTWPFALQLPAGDYRLQVFNGEAIACQQRITIRPDKKETVRCQPEAESSTLSPRGTFGLDAHRFSKEFLQATRMNIYGRDSRVTSARSHEVPILEASDASLGLSLKAFPANEALRLAWQSTRSRGDTTSLQEFARFARRQVPPLQLVLECPVQGFQMTEYNWLALTLAPDYLEVFGCQQAEKASELIAVAQSLQQRSKHPIKFAVASPTRSFYALHGQIPAMYVPAGKTQREAADLMSDLKSGLYSVGLRSEIEIIDNPLLLNTSLRELQLRIRSLDLKRHAGIIRIYDQNKLLSQHPLAASTSLVQDLRLPLAFDSDSRWLRIELLRDAAASGEKSSEFLLATTNYLRLDKP